MKDNILRTKLNNTQELRRISEIKLNFGEIGAKSRRKSFNVCIIETENIFEQGMEKIQSQRDF